MLSFFDFLLSVHRAFWFPLNALLGLEAQGVELPVQFAPHIATVEVDPAAVESALRRRTRPAANW
jgi:hypothetical protein